MKLTELLPLNIYPFTLIFQHLRAVSSFLLRIGLDEQKMESECYNDLKKRLDLNSKKSEDLMLQYYLLLAKHMATPTEYYGHLALKAAYMEETRGNITIFVKGISVQSNLS